MYFGKSNIIEYINTPSPESIENFGTSLITVSATLIGFLLTIITVIVTFKNGFKDNILEASESIKKPIDPVEGPDSTVFDTKVSKEHQFYGTGLHKKVADVFVGATYEVGLVLFVILALQFKIITTTHFAVCLITLSAFILLGLSVIRSFYIFKLFLNVHLHDKKPKNM
ncbi:MAG: hypothetical protein COB15_07805 [Flavobacteriales bacterium]|nr:MAG: hypothetical protein COB15_07805 [Flavobacteriales bacterium]